MITCVIDATCLMLLDTGTLSCTERDSTNEGNQIAVTHDPFRMPVSIFVADCCQADLGASCRMHVTYTRNECMYNALQCIFVFQAGYVHRSVKISAVYAMQVSSAHGLMTWSLAVWWTQGLYYCGTTENPVVLITGQ